MSKDKRSNKWAFLLYQESVPKNYLEVLEELHIPFVLSPWHDKDVNKETGEFKKAHKHGALFFESLKSLFMRRIQIKHSMISMTLNQVVDLS